MLHRCANRLRLVLVLAALLLTGCANLEQWESNRKSLNDIEAELTALQDAVADARTELADLQTSTQDSEAREVEALTALRQQLDGLPGAVGKICRQPVAPLTGNCESAKTVQTVVTTNDKLLMGEVERVWLSAPQRSFVARIDTGAASSSIHAENVVEFERDGEDWVRFDCLGDEGSVTLERKVERYVRVVQQSDRSGTRRAVVNLRLTIGNIEDTFEFTLADRSHLDQALILGRNFLTDIALVDVARRFVQPAPPRAEE